MTPFKRYGMQIIPRENQDYENAFSQKPFDYILQMVDYFVYDVGTI